MQWTSHIYLFSWKDGMQSELKMKSTYYTYHTCIKNIWDSTKIASFMVKIVVSLIM